MLPGTISSSRSSGSCKTIKKQMLIRKPKWSISRSKNCGLPLVTVLIVSDFVSSFKQRFKSLIDQYELRELHFHSLLRSKELEVQYHMARFNKEQKNAEVEATRSRALNAQVMTFSKTESELRSQLNIYVEKFKQVRDEALISPILPNFFCMLSIFPQYTDTSQGGRHAQ